MEEIVTGRLLLRQFRESDYDDLFEFLEQQRDDEFEGYPGITYENGRAHLACRIVSEGHLCVREAPRGRDAAVRGERGVGRLSAERRASREEARKRADRDRGNRAPRRRGKCRNTPIAKAPGDLSHSGQQSSVVFGC